jgi:FKBP-type peptidyl-prolyl cis-trans isomerase 2
MVPISSFQDRISEVISRELLNDTMTQVVSKSSLGQIGLDIRVGDMLISKDKSTAKVIKVEGDQVTIEFKNTLNPFYGKPLTVGLKGIFEGKEIVITKIDDKEVTVDVDNKANPFYGRPLTVGLTGTMPDGSSMTIIQISAENVLVEIPTPANLVGKTIILSVEIKSIQKASK